VDGSTKSTAAVLMPSTKNQTKNGKAAVTPCIAIDCEFVGVGLDGVRDQLARVSIVNFHGEVIYDRYVRAIEEVTDYRTHVSGIKAHHLTHAAVTFKQCQRDVSELLSNRILVGHAVHNDLSVLLLSHPSHLIRDTSKYKPFCPDRRPRSLKVLAKTVLGITIQTGSHDSVEDARTALVLYKKARVEWEKMLYDKQHRRFPSSTSASASASASSASASAAVTPLPATSSTSSAISSSASTSASTSVHGQHPPAAKRLKSSAAAADLEAAERRQQEKAERNRRRKLMRKQQKLEKQNR